MIFFILVSSITFASAADLSYVDTGDVVVFDQQNGAYINLTGQQNFSEFNFTAPTLNITINNSYSTYNNTANLTLSSVSYSNDKLNFTGIATSGILNILAKMSSISTYYHLFIDNIKITSVISDIVGVVNYVWSSWSSHFFSIQINIAPSISNVTNQNVNEGQVVFVDIDGSDANGDTLTFLTNSTNFTDFNSTTGKGNWTTNYTSSGNYSILFNITDGLSVTSQVMLINVSNVPLNISSFLPTSNPTITEGASQVFNTTLNRPANVAWLLNGIQIQYNSSVTVANYSNNIAGAGVHNVTANINESASPDTDIHIWSWTVQAAQSTTSTSSGGGGSSISPVTTGTGAEEAWDDGRKDYPFAVLLDGTNGRLEFPQSNEHGIVALNLFFKEPVMGTYTITLSTYTDYKPRLNGSLKYFSIATNFNLKPRSSVELISGQAIELYQLDRSENWNKLSKGIKPSKNTYRFPVTSFGIFAVKQAGKQEVTTNTVQPTKGRFDINFSQVFKNLEQKDHKAYEMLKVKPAWLVKIVEEVKVLVFEMRDNLL